MDRSFSPVASMSFQTGTASAARCQQHQFDTGRYLAEPSLTNIPGLTGIQSARQGTFAAPANVPRSHSGAVPGKTGFVLHSADEQGLNDFNIHRVHTCRCHLCLLYQVLAPAAQFKRHKRVHRRPDGVWQARLPRKGTLTLFALDWAPPGSQSLGNLGKGGL